jgi:hypothetical protein
MHRFAKLIPICGFIASTFVIGTPFWLLPYAQLNLPNGLYGPGLLLLVCSAAASHAFAAATFWKSVAIAAAALPTIVMLRVSFETTADPTSHNLWPFELLISGMLGFTCALAGGLIGLALVTFRGSVTARST